MVRRHCSVSPTRTLSQQSERGCRGHVRAETPQCYVRGSARRLPCDGFKSPHRSWIKIELFDHQAAQAPIATRRASKIDCDGMVEWKYTLFSAHSCPPFGQSQPKVRLCRRIDPDQAGSCEQVLPCFHQPYVQFVLSDPQRRSGPTSFACRTTARPRSSRSPRSLLDGRLR